MERRQNTSDRLDYYEVGFVTRYRCINTSLFSVELTYISSFFSDLILVKKCKTVTLKSEGNYFEYKMFEFLKHCSHNKSNLAVE
jgi:hypothetical protein